MDLPRRGLTFSRITYHAEVTQCLGGLNPPQPWYIVVAAPTGSVAEYPKQQDLTAFKVPHGTAIKFKQGTWHAGGSGNVCVAILIGVGSCMPPGAHAEAAVSEVEVHKLRTRTCIVGLCVDLHHLLSKRTLYSIVLQCVKFTSHKLF